MSIRSELDDIAHELLGEAEMIFDSDNDDLELRRDCIAALVQRLDSLITPKLKVLES